jgi:two-component system OmpR family sensor kinase
VTVGLSPGTSDVTDALTMGKVSSFEGSDPNTGEKIIAVSTPLEYNGMIVGVMRYVSSLRIVYRQTLISSGVAAILCLAVILLVFVSNMTFIRNIVEPVAELTEAAKLISGGSYGIQMENKYHDEIGELIDSINDMSQKISQNEKMQQEFISSVSHELRTPLTAIAGWGETLLADIGSDSPQTRRGLGIILKESRRLTNMVEELLEFSKMQDGRFTLRMEKVDIQAEFEDAIYTYRELFRQDGIEVNYEEGPELPPISGDPERLKQVFCNILDNAAKHGGSGKRIDTSVTGENGMIVIRVRDYGPGIPEAELPFVKQKFYKGSSKARGSGIGLAVADEIMNRHGGRFDIGNAEGGGCIVSLYLPVE